MFGTEWIGNNEILRIVLTLGILILIYYGVGRILQNRFKLLRTHRMLAIPMGFFTMQAVFFVITGVFLVFNVKNNFVYWINITIHAMAVITMIAFSREWLPNYKEISIRRIFGIVVFMGMLAGLMFTNDHFQHYNWYAPDPSVEVIEGLDALTINLSEAEYLVSGVDQFYTQFQTFSYWQVSIARVAGISNELMLEVMIPTLAGIIIIPSLYAFAKNRGWYVPTLTSLPFTFGIFIASGLVGQSGIQMALPTIAFIITMLYTITNNVRPNRTAGYVVIIAASFLFMSNDMGIFLFVIFAFANIYITSRYETSPTFQLNLTLIMLSIIIVAMVYSTAGFMAVFPIIISLAILIPLNLAITNYRTSVIINIDKAFYESRRSIAVVFTITVLVISTISAIVTPETFVESFVTFYRTSPINFSDTNENLNIAVTSAMFASAFIIPTFGTLVLNDNTSRSALQISSMALLIFNPLTVAALGNILGLQNIFGLLTIAIMIPTLLSTWTIATELSKNVFKSLK